MPEKRKIRAPGGKVKVQRTTTQTTLKDHFQRESPGVGPTGKAQELHADHTNPVAPSLQAADPHPPMQLSVRPKPSQLFPIFTKVSSVSEGLRDTVIGVDDTEVIDITDISSDIDLPTEPSLSSTHHSPPHSQFSHTTSHSPSPSPIDLDVPCYESATSLPHAGTHEHTHPHGTGKVLNKRILGLGDLTPFPSSYSQHVRGPQHSYTSGQTPLKRRVLPRLRPWGQGTLDFLKKWRQPDNVPSVPLGHTRRSLTSRQCEERLQSFSHDHRESHPAFARISICREEVPLRHAETWARRFRPRCANEVLGNEQHAIYLRDWLSALGLQLRARQPEAAAPKGITTGEKGASKRADPRGVKRPRVVRAVARNRGSKKRRVDSDDDLDGFVVSSDADEEQVDGSGEDSEDELAFCQRTLARLHRHDTVNAQEVPSTTEVDHATSQPLEFVRANFDDNLTNTLLITGPPGCGKTAAVYACAEELGWEVFEVYPGIGKRNGANIDRLVGDVGKNHLVQTVHGRAPTKTGGKERTGLRGYLARGRAGRNADISKARVAGTETEPISVEADSPTRELQSLPPDRQASLSDGVAISGMCQAESDGLRQTVGQSLVLLEEVDILFKEDAGFWPAVIEFIECCQRPVVMTCNDPGLVPVGDLPLQTVLVFEPCPSTVAATFLQCLSLTEGWLVPHEDLMAVYEGTQCTDGVERAEVPLHPRAELVRLPDLRRSIMQLQMLCAGARHGSAMDQGEEAAGSHVRRSGRAISAACRGGRMGSAAEGAMWRQMRCESELMSRVDAELCRTPTAMGQTVGTAGDAGGYVVLGGEGLVDCWRDELIAEEAIRHARGIHEWAGAGPGAASINPAAAGTASEDVGARVVYRARMADALQGIVAGAGAVTGESGVFLDYIPWVRHMVVAGDEAEAETRRAGGRRTRNSGRAGRAGAAAGAGAGSWASEGQRAVLRGTRLVGGERG